MSSNVQPALRVVETREDWSPVRIRTLDISCRAAWDAFVDRQTDATFFHRAGWKDVIELAFDHTTHYLLAEQRGDIVGILPLVHVKSRLFGNTLSSLPFCVYGGVVAEHPAAAALLIDHATGLAKSLGVDALELRNLKPSGRSWPSKDLYVTFRKAISADNQENLNAIPRKQRAMVRKGMEAGLQSRWDGGIVDFYNAYSQSVHALGTPVFSRRYFEILRDVFKYHSRILTITKDDRTVASVLSFYFRDEVIPYYGGGTAEARGLKANDFMYWELMRRSADEGIRSFDYGRSKQNSGSYSFKKNWGFEPQPLHYEYFLVNGDSIPEVNPNNPKYQRLIRLWQKLPLKATQLVGPHIVKYLG